MFLTSKQTKNRVHYTLGNFFLCRNKFSLQISFLFLFISFHLSILFLLLQCIFSLFCSFVKLFFTPLFINKREKNVSFIIIKHFSSTSSSQKAYIKSNGIFTKQIFLLFIFQIDFSFNVCIFFSTFSIS